MRHLTGGELDAKAIRLEEIEAEADALRSTLREQVEEFGFAPPRSERSKRLSGELYQFTVTRGVSVEIKDAEVSVLRQVCPGTHFERLFRVVTKFKLVEGAAQVLASRLPLMPRATYG